VGRDALSTFHSTSSALKSPVRASRMSRSRSEAPKGPSCARKLFEEALQLPDPERANLASELLASLPGDPADDLDPAWASEIGRRARRAHADPDGGVRWETVRDDLLAELRRG
jgi:putative addiction module component (TIGR02574 family)